MSQMCNMGDQYWDDYMTLIHEQIAKQKRTHMLFPFHCNSFLFFKKVNKTETTE